MRKKKKTQPSKKPRRRLMPFRPSGRNSERWFRSRPSFCALKLRVENKTCEFYAVEDFWIERLSTYFAATGVSMSFPHRSRLTGEVVKKTFLLLAVCRLLLESARAAAGENWPLSLSLSQLKREGLLSCSLACSLASERTRKARVRKRFHRRRGLFFFFFFPSTSSSSLFTAPPLFFALPEFRLLPAPPHSPFPRSNAVLPRPVYARGRPRGTQGRRRGPRRG